MSASASNYLQEPLFAAAKERLPFVLLGLALLLHFALSLFLIFEAPRGFYNSPDEMANAFFAQGVAEDGKLVRPPPTPDLPASVVPRGALRTEAELVPVGFASFPLTVGVLAKLLSFPGVLLLISLISTLAILAWFGFLRPLFGMRLALISTFLTAAHPLVLYWSARPLLPNTLFLALIIISLYCLARIIRLRLQSLPSVGEVTFEKPPAEQPKVARRTLSLFSGLTLGLAVALRPQEGLWLAAIPFFLIVVRTLRRQISWSFFVLPAVFPLAGLLALQRELYGSPLRTGYHLTPAGVGARDFVRAIIAPFGIDLAHIGGVLYHFVLDLGWIFAALTLVGVIVMMIKKDGRLLRRLRILALAAAALLVWLLLFYGSFEVPDRFDRAPASIGTSFTRYFLPFYVLIIPVAGWALFALRRRMGRVVMAVLVPLAVILSLRAVWWSSDESLLRISKVLTENKEIRARALELLSDDAVVFTDRSDKIIFPAREVVTRFRKFHQPDFEELYGLNLYYETIADEDFVAWENERFWGPHKLKAVDPVELGYRHKLYKLILLQE